MKELLTQKLLYFFVIFFPKHEPQIRAFFIRT